MDVCHKQNGKKSKNKNKWCFTNNNLAGEVCADVNIDVRQVMDTTRYICYMCPWVRN